MSGIPRSTPTEAWRRVKAPAILRSRKVSEFVAELSARVSFRQWTKDHPLEHKK